MSTELWLCVRQWRTNLQQHVRHAGQGLRVRTISSPCLCPVIWFGIQDGKFILFPKSLQVLCSTLFYFFFLNADSKRAWQLRTKDRVLVERDPVLCSVWWRQWKRRVLSCVPLTTRPCAEQTKKRTPTSVPSSMKPASKWLLFAAFHACKSFESLKTQLIKKHTSQKLSFRTKQFIRVDYSGKCQSENQTENHADPCAPRPCPLNLDYVCGTDGRTYPNECALETEACRCESLQLSKTFVALTRKTRSQIPFSVPTCPFCPWELNQIFSSQCEERPYSSKIRGQLPLVIFGFVSGKRCMFGLRTKDVASRDSRQLTRLLQQTEHLFISCISLNGKYYEYIVT